MYSYLNSVKNKNVEAIINALCDYSNLSKKELCTKTGLSITTVVKVLSKLEEKHIVSSLSRKARYERKPNRIYRISDKFFSVIYILTEDYFFAYFTKMNSSIINKITYKYNSSLEFELNLRYFKKCVTTNLPSAVKNCVCCTLMLPGKYNKDLDIVRPSRIPGINIMTVGDLISELSLGCPFECNDLRIFLSDYSASVLGDGETSLDMYLFQNEFSANVINHTSVAQYASFSEISDTSSQRKIPMLEKFDNSTDVIQQIDAMTHYISNLIDTLPITDIHIFGNYYSDFTDFSSVLSEILTMKFQRPILINRNINNADFIKFIAKKIRINRFMDFIFNKQVDK